MNIEFEIDGDRAVFERNSTTGRAAISYRGETIRLQSPFNPLTHMTLGTRSSWKRDIAGHVVEIVKTRLRMWGGLRPNDYQVIVDGQLVAEESGQ